MFAVTALLWISNWLACNYERLWSISGNAIFTFTEISHKSEVFGIHKKSPLNEWSDPQHFAGNDEQNPGLWQVEYSEKCGGIHSESIPGNIIAPEHLEIQRCMSGKDRGHSHFCADLWGFLGRYYPAKELSISSCKNCLHNCNSIF